jgi:peptide/nickel transport system substrate-binding protein
MYFVKKYIIFNKKNKGKEKVMKKRISIIKFFMIPILILMPVLMLNASAKKEVVIPRNRTLISVGGGGEAPLQFTDYESMNPYYLAHISSHGAQVVYEPLYFYNYMKDEEVPWLATSYQYNSDFTNLTITIRSGVKWSDNVDFTAEDVVYTLIMLRDHAPELRYSGDIQKWVKDAVAVDKLTVRITFNAPNTRFMFDYLTNHQDIGIWIVPKHIWEKHDPTEFSNYDIEKGLPVLTGPYKLHLSTADQTIWDLREDWWAAKTGFHALPQVKRLIFLPAFDETKHAQMMINNEVDVSLNLSPENIQKVLKANPKVSTFSHDKPPFGYKDWWPTSMGFNCSEPPFNDPEIRWAIAYAINPKDVITYGLQGMGSSTKVFFPEFPPLMKYIDAVQDLFKEYDPNEYNPQKTANIMMKKGYTKDSDGFWVDSTGKRIKIEIITFSVLQSIAPPIVENLRRAGFDASFQLPVDWFERLSLGTGKAFLFGHAASVRDPYAACNLYTSQFNVPTGKPTFPFYRWSNPEIDRIVEKMAMVPHDDPRLVGLFHDYMEIWLPELPDIPLCSYYHRNPINHTYWEGWPSVDDPYANDANWHKTFLLILLKLKPTQ